MNTPPPLPNAAAGFVNVLGRLSLVVAVFGLVWALGQMILALVLPDAMLMRLATLPEAPPGLLWVLEHRRLLALAALALALVFLAVAWGLLKRQEWARWGFIVLLVAGALANFAALALIGPFFDGLLGMFPAAMMDSAEGREFAAQMQASRSFSFASSLVTAIAFAVLHGWVIWKLCTAPVRAQFGCRAA